ncbi:hypothetical protein NJB18091_37100 [Mycobacterium marinum]|uniref:DUF4326 domain-containing protein n=1 Tax=Mycobacterium marinum TaxID=1781 RepID=UPI0021C46937|nr:DUF4326 domain-containing protein [Mycobacterium marinum]GJO02324.1 hypothetical protein NJB18091_37100 [Mycobacterium marinum]
MTDELQNRLGPTFDCPAPPTEDCTALGYNSLSDPFSNEEWEHIWAVHRGGAVAAPQWRGPPARSTDRAGAFHRKEPNAPEPEAQTSAAVRKKGWREPPNTVVVSRPTRWGSPFRVTAAGGMGAARARYAQCLDSQRLVEIDSKTYTGRRWPRSTRSCMARTWRAGAR